jgi:hypothetical protein
LPKVLCRSNCSQDDLYHFLGCLVLGVKPLQAFQWPRKAIWLYGVVEPATGESFFYEFSHLDTACFECFLQLLSEAYPDVLNLVQCDQAPAHSGYDLVIPDNVVLLYQPPHSPELNPIERVWEDVKIDLKGDNFANLYQTPWKMIQIVLATSTSA